MNLLKLIRNYSKSTISIAMEIPIHRNGIILQDIIKKFEEFAPLRLAESWDNVGLLLEPNTSKLIRTVFLTNDLTEPVLFEAVNKSADLIVSYHPPVFASLKRITKSHWKERIVSVCLEKGIAIYSPHTAWDSAKNGVNDWLASAFEIKSCIPIVPNADDVKTGAGRILQCSHFLKLNEIITHLKNFLNLNHLQVAIGVNKSLDSNIQNIAICAGSGGSILKNIDADLYITGEMSHHDVLDAIHHGVSVVLVNHSNSERGYLKSFAQFLKSNDFDTIVSTVDEDPLKTY